MFSPPIVRKESRYDLSDRLVSARMPIGCSIGISRRCWVTRAPA